ncbi:nucleoside diphosphate kinase regulator [Zavarzinia sp. CC-PAN008]|uniref:nucleoside diphosphate kinase regulator n=1 Tax=Zavarzinia sp. CC-PAN008 TaxID=3243332 RepID=UPI003F748339
MTVASRANRARRPAIHLIDQEADALSGLALSIEQTAPVLAEQLLGEIDRAVIHAAASLPRNTVSMGATVEYLDEGSGVTRTVQLAWPQEADIDAGRISILTPIGAALIGLAKGATILWPDRSGAERVLRIVSVTPPRHSPSAARS